MRLRSMRQFGDIVDRSSLNIKYERRGGLARLGAAHRVFGAVAGPRLREHAQVLAIDGKRLVIAAAMPSALEQLRALEPVLIPALAQRLPGPTVAWIDYLIDPNARTPMMGRTERERRVAGPPPPEVEETAARLPAGPLRERFSQWMTLTMESGKERL